MSEFKNDFVILICFFVWTAGCFMFGYIFSDRQATERISQANRELAEQQQKYEVVIATTTERLRDITTKLSGAVDNNEQATTELSAIINEIRKQKLNL